MTGDAMEERKAREAERRERDQHPRCWWCHKEIWPLMDQRKDEQGNLMHAYCWLSYRKAANRSLGY
jgi:hypothetical protein